MRSAKGGKQPDVARRIRNRLAGDIAAGRFIGRLPGERVLARHFRATLVQVRAALELLESDGLIQRRPRQAARILATRPAGVERSPVLDRILLLTTRQFAHSVFANRVMVGLQQAAGRRGIVTELLATPIDEVHDFLARMFDDHDAHRSGWVLLDLVVDPALVVGWLKREQPFVFLDSVPPSLKRQVNFVGFAADLAVRAATEHLLSLGHRRIALVQQERDGSVPGLRNAGFRWAMQNAGIQPDDALHVHYGRSAGDTVDIIAPLRRLLRTSDRPTAIVGAGQNVAADARDVCRAEGVDVPGELSIIGAGASYPPVDTDETLTVVDQGRPDHLAELAVDLLLRHATPADPLQILLDPQLIVRSSTAAPPAMRK